MRHEITFAADAAQDLSELRAYDRSQVRDGIERFLRYQPEVVGKARIKRLRGFARPQYRLRVGDDIRVFYDVHGGVVEIIAVISKETAAEWLQREGVRE